MSSADGAHAAIFTIVAVQGSLDRRGECFISAPINTPASNCDPRRCRAVVTLPVLDVGPCSADQLDLIIWINTMVWSMLLEKSQS
jgi:hypothetical protein